MVVIGVSVGKKITVTLVTFSNRRVRKQNIIIRYGCSLKTGLF